MPNFNLFHGGLRPANANLAMFPSVPPEPTMSMDADVRGVGATTSRFRHLAWPGSQAALNCATCAGFNCTESKALADFCGTITTTLAAGDTIDIVVIPAGSVLRSVYWRVDGAVAGMAYTLSHVSTTGASPVVTAIASSTIDGAVLASGMIVLVTPVLFPVNGLLRLNLTAIPASTAANAACRLRGVSLMVAPELYRPMGGDF